MNRAKEKLHNVQEKTCSALHSVQCEAMNFKTISGEIMSPDQFQSAEWRYFAYDCQGGSANMDKAGTRWVCYGYQGGFGLIKPAKPYTSQYGNTYYR